MHKSCFLRISINHLMPLLDCNVVAYVYFNSLMAEHTYFDPRMWYVDAQLHVCGTETTSSTRMVPGRSFHVCGASSDSPYRVRNQVVPPRWYYSGGSPFRVSN